MLVGDFLNIVKSGNLSETKVTDSSLLNFLNLGLIELYGKYSLSVQEENYVLTSDTEYDLPDNFISCIKVTSPGIYYRSNEGLITPLPAQLFELSINSYGDYNGILITEYGMLKVDNPIVGQPIRMIYKAAPKELTTQNLTAKLKIGNQYLEALSMYMTYLGFMQNGGGTQADSNTYLNRYIMACNALEANGDTNKISNINNKFNERGFA